jgi:hypothetical protein
MQASTFKRSLIAVAVVAALGAGYARFGGEVVRSRSQSQRFRPLR